MFPIIYHVNKSRPRYHYIFHCILFTEPGLSWTLLIAFSCQIFTITDKRLYCQKINASVNDSINIDPHSVLCMCSGDAKWDFKCGLRWAVCSVLPSLLPLSNVLPTLTKTSTTHTSSFSLNVTCGMCSFCVTHQLTRAVLYNSEEPNITRYRGSANPLDKSNAGAGGGFCLGNTGVLGARGGERMGVMICD